MIFETAGATWQDEVAELQDRYHRLVELAPDGILIHDGDRITMVNVAATELAGAADVDQLVGHRIEDFLNPPYLKGIEEHLVAQGLDAFLATGGPVATAARDRFRRVDGSSIDVEVTAIPFVDHGQPGAHLVIRDITQRLQQEASVIRVESQLRLVLEQMPATLWTTDSELRVVSLLGGRRAGPGDRRRESIGSPFNPGMLSAPGSALLTAQRRALEGASVAHDVEEAGRVFEVHVKPLQGPDGAVTGVVGLALDVTDRRRTEAHLQAAQRMEMVGDLAGGVAHEVNNMMTVVFAFTELLAMGLTDDAPRLADVQEITRAAERTAKVSRQLLAFSRRAPRRPETLELDAVVSGLLPTVRQLLGEGRSLVTALQCPRCVRFDRAHLEQVVVNLALNARYAMAPGGTLTVTTMAAAIVDNVRDYAGASIPPGPYGCLAVGDSGVGMDNATMARLFEPFFTTKPVGEGTGLGLAAVKGIMEQGGGYITVESSPHLGTTFTLYLPLLPDTAAAELQETPPPLPSRAASGSTVLLVEDEPALRAVAARTLELQGYRVLQAANGDAALALIERHGPPDLVLTDLVMPGMGGLELATA